MTGGRKGASLAGRTALTTTVVAIASRLACNGISLGTLEVGRHFQIVVVLDRCELTGTLAAEIAIASAAITWCTFAVRARWTVAMGTFAALATWTARSAAIGTTIVVVAARRAGKSFRTFA